MVRFVAGKGVQYALVLLFAVTLNFMLPRMMPGSPLIFLVGEDAGFMSAEQGPLAAWRRRSAVDVGSVGIAMFFDSVPSFWLGMVFIAVFAAGLRWFPIFGAQTPGVSLAGWGMVANTAWHLALPLATLTLITIPGNFLIMRYSMLNVLGEQYIATAKAKGLAERTVIYRHAMRNALLPMATVVMLNLGFIASGATGTDTTFSYPGVGRLLYEAVLNRDYPVIQATFFILTVSVIAANVLADLLYPLIDPRVRHAR